ncbi:Phosphotransferase enzyme family protein [Mycobacterium sp. THAF192]|nr:Phosphotransferase enzyme family protein [Mycobacterium sp. THAF192]
MTTIPCAKDDLTPEGLTALLSGRAEWSGLEIADLDCVPVGTGQMAHSYRLSLTYANRPDGAPDRLIAKVPSTDPTSRQMGLATGAYQREVYFYQHLADLTQVRSPRCYFGQIADNNCDFLLLLEDLGPAETVEQIGGCSADQAALALEQAAALHAGSWNHDTLREQSWLPVEHVWNALAGAIPQVIAPWLDRFGSHLDTEHVAAVERLGREVPAWLATLTEHRTLWHGDFRLDNLLFEAHGGTTPIAVIDWQSVAAAPGVIDASYLLGTSLSEADRASHERAWSSSITVCSRPTVSPDTPLTSAGVSIRRTPSTPWFSTSLSRWAWRAPSAETRCSVQWPVARHNRSSRTTALRLWHR